MTEDEIKKLVQGELDQFAKNYYRRNYPNFNMTSGHISEAHGVSEYIVATDTGQSIQFYKQGNGKIVARKSLELVAGDKATNKDVSISIRAEDGHIHTHIGRKTSLFEVTMSFLKQLMLREQLYLNLLKFFT